MFEKFEQILCETCDGLVYYIVLTKQSSFKNVFKSDTTALQKPFNWK